MRFITVTITKPAGTTTLATLAGTAADGSVRDLSWNGPTSKAQQGAAGEVPLDADRTLPTGTAS